MCSFFIHFPQTEKRNEAKRKFYDRAISKALQTINGYELRLFMSILYGMLSVESVMNPTTKVDVPRFGQRWIRGNETMHTNHPGLVAPISTVFFWVHRLRLNVEDLVISNDVGYCAVEELQAELRGFYSFYMNKCRYVLDFFRTSFVFILWNG